MAAAAGILLASAAASGWWSQRGDGGLQVGRPSVRYTIGPLEPSQRDFSLGGLFLEHQGKELKILNVDVLASANTQFLGAFTTWPRDIMTDRRDAGPGFPSPDMKNRHPALDTVIPASETSFRPRGWTAGVAPPVTVNVGFRIVSGDAAAVNGVRVTYEVDGKQTHQDFHYAVVTCLKPNRCDWPDGAEDQHKDDYQQTMLREFGLIPD